MSNLNINLNGVQPTLVSGTNIKTVNGESVLGIGDLEVGGGVSFGTNGKIPFMNGAGDNFDYSSGFTRVNGVVGVGTDTPLRGNNDTNLLDIGGSTQVNPAINPIITITGDSPSIISAQFQNKSANASASMRFVVAANDNSYGAFTQPSSTNGGSFFNRPKMLGTFLLSSNRELGIGTIGLKRVVIGTNNTHRMTILPDGDIGIGTTEPTSKFQVVGLNTYADNSAAIAAGLTAGAMYIRTGHGLDIVV